VELEGSIVDHILQADIGVIFFSKENKILTQFGRKVRLLYNNKVSSMLPRSSF